jgi:hypothetical protein
MATPWTQPWYYPGDIEVLLAPTAPCTGTKDADVARDAFDESMRKGSLSGSGREPVLIQFVRQAVTKGRGGARYPWDYAWAPRIALYDADAAPSTGPSPTPALDLYLTADACYVPWSKPGRERQYGAQRERALRDALDDRDYWKPGALPPKGAFPTSRAWLAYDVGYVHDPSAPPYQRGQEDQVRQQLEALMDGRKLPSAPVLEPSAPTVSSRLECDANGDLSLVLGCVRPSDQAEQDEPDEAPVDVMIARYPCGAFD